MVTAGGVVLLVLGVLLLSTATYDALRTTVAPAAGGGFLTRHVTARMWWLARRLARSPRSWVLKAAGTVVLLATMGTWVLLLWVGWTLVFAAEPGAVLQSSTRAPADLTGTIYFAGFTLFTLGVGDYVPGDGVWQVLTPVVTLHGLFTVTLSITYLVPVMTAATERRQQALSVWGLGGSPTGIVTGGWGRGSFTALERNLQQLVPGLLTTVERHPTYPVLHYFHSGDPRLELAVRAAAVDEATTLLLYAVRPHAAPDPSVLVSVHRAVDALVRTLDSTEGTVTAAVPPVPDLAPLRTAGVPLRDDAEVSAAYTALAQRRRRLHALVAEHAWTWDAVTEGPDDGYPLRPQLSP